MVGATLNYKTMNNTKKKPHPNAIFVWYQETKNESENLGENEKMGNACQQMHINLSSISIV